MELRVKHWWRTFGEQRSYAVLVSAACLVIALLTLCVAVLMDGRADAIRLAQTISQNLSMVAERDIRRNFEIIDLSLQSMVKGAEDPETMAMATGKRDALLFNQALSARYLGAVLVLDENGNIVVDAGHQVPRVGNYADRDYFQAQKHDPGLGMLISRPVASKILHDGSMIIALSRRINHPDGSFAGIALITLSIRYFHDLLAGLDIGPHGAIALFERDGTVITRLPQIRNATTPSILSRSSIFASLVNEASGAFVGTSPFDGERRLFVHTIIEPSGLTLVISPAERDIYAPWHRRTWILGGAMVALALGYVLLAELLASELRRRSIVEAELRELSRTDALTTVGNRRYFDETLATEWKRSMREGTPLSVLFVDVDCFKQFNDRYGHERGDDALRSVALAMKRQLKRPADFLARYGGEEFAMVLPHTDRHSVTQIAQIIANAVIALDIPNEASHHQIVTVSIGCASLERDCPHETSAALLKAADAALYRAKHNGRNRVEAAA